MLGDHPIQVILLAPDLDASKEFYANKIGLKILTESPDAVSFQCGGDSQLDVTKSTIGTADSQTQAAWRVSDLAAHITELRSRGVQIEEYDGPGLKTEDGIADLGFAFMAWFIDPGKNCLAMMPLK
jgi:catechol 2,3-dioxygenase-like lactoylglutathione lyase family enzyme